MSNVVAESSQSTRSASKKRSTSAVVWLVVLLVAAIAFGATVVWAGGIDEVLNLVGLGSVSGPSSDSNRAGGGATKPPASNATTSAASAAAATKLPASASDAMYREQLQSQTNIGKLVDNKIASFTLGTPVMSTSSAVVPVTVAFRNGSSASGRMTFKKYNDLWYFFSITASGGGSATPHAAVDSAVVSVITRQQATKANQDNIVNGLLGGGYKNVRVTGVTKGSGTATVDVTMSGGTDASETGQFVCIAKKDGSTTYWFLARFAGQ